MSNYKIIMTGGGTAGHVTPNLALVPKLKEKGFDIKYIGSYEGIEKEIIVDAGIPYFAISSGKLRRYFDMKNLVSHESDLTPGLANKLSSPFCDKLCVTFRESLNYIKDGKGELTGTPIREEILKGSRIRGKDICNFNNEKEVILVIGGSLGAKSINDEVRYHINEILKDFNVIHICGKGNLEKSLEGLNGYKQFEYVKEDLPHLLQYADFVISRAGANVIFELLALRKPTLLIPLSKKSSRGDQILNANSFLKEGYSLILDEDEMKEKHNLPEKLSQLRNKKDELIKNMTNSEMKNGVDAILNVIMKSINKK